MDLQKVKEAKEYLYDAISCVLRGVPVRDLDERMYALNSAIDELEKPVNDVSLNKIIYTMALNFCGAHSSSEYERAEKNAISIFQRYAESYAARQCHTCPKLKNALEQHTRDRDAEIERIAEKE